MSAVISTVSAPGVRFIAAHEGCVLKAYRCPAGVVTVGYGFTMRSKVFAAWFRGKYGRDLKLGDTISRADADMLLKRVLDAEYGASVVRDVAARKQHHHDAASSVSFNCGPGSLKWKWAAALKSGDAKTAAALLRNTAVTANGRRLAGLVRRRAEEAKLIETGTYGKVSATASQSTGSDDVLQYQEWLVALGYKIAVDGVAGPKTLEAVKDFQRRNGLTVDGIVGPATRATMIRAIDAKRGSQASGGAAVGGAVAGSGGDVSTADAAISALGWGLAALAVVSVCILVLRYRGVITGRRIPT